MSEPLTLEELLELERLLLFLEKPENAPGSATAANNGASRERKIEASIKGCD